MRPEPEFHVACYYGDNAKPPRKPGELAIQTHHWSEGSMYIEVLAARNRKDIGRVEWWGPVSDLVKSLLEGKDQIGRAEIPQ